MKDEAGDVGLQPSSFRLHPLLGFLVTSVFSATATELAKFQALSRRLLILGGRIVPTLTISTLKNNVVARHNPTSLLFVRSS